MITVYEPTAEYTTRYLITYPQAPCDFAYSRDVAQNYVTHGPAGTQMHGQHMVRHTNGNSEWVNERRCPFNR